MWYQPSRPMYHPASPTKQEPSEETDMHAHSPRRRIDSASMTSLDEKMSDKMSVTYGSMHSSQRPHGSQPVSQVPGWPAMPDPFVEIGHHNRYGVRSSELDASMLDYFNPTGGRNASDDVSMRSLNNSSHQDVLDDLIPIFSCDNSSGTNAPANTRVSSAVNTPNVPTRPSAAAEARAASYKDSQERMRAVSIISKDDTPKRRDPSDVSMQSRFSEDVTEAAKFQVRVPAMEIKGRKEGKGNEQGMPSEEKKEKKASRVSTGRMGSSDKENEQENDKIVIATVSLSDGKRKRVNTGLGQELLRNAVEGRMSSSPTTARVKRVLVGDSGSEDEEESVGLGKERVVLGALGDMNGGNSVS
jgi:hypothetical protein